MICMYSSFESFEAIYPLLIRQKQASITTTMVVNATRCHVRPSKPTPSDLPLGVELVVEAWSRGCIVPLNDASIGPSVFTTIAEGAYSSVSKVNAISTGL